MAGIKELKTRIKSIQGTRKVTRAMQMVSAAKMRKSQDATTKSRTYSTLAWELIMNLSTSEQIRSELLKTHPKAEKIAVLILSTNRGLVGGLNSNLFNFAQKIINEHLVSTVSAEGKSANTVDVVSYGRKSREWTVRSGKEVLADFEKFDRTITTEDIYPIAELLTDLYKSKKYKKVLIIYNHFVSTLSQQPRVKQLLPFSKVIVETTHQKKDKESLDYEHAEYLFEPTPKYVMRHLLPRIIESQIYQTILESEASEQSARMVMMKNATEAAWDLISDLTLTYNKLRQNKITTELAEITAGKIALE